MTRREFMRVIAALAPAAYVIRGAGILPALRGQDARNTKDKGGTRAPHCLGEYPGEVVPMEDISKQSKWSG